MKTILILSTCCLGFMLPACSQNSTGSSTTPGKDITVGGPCEGCEALFEFPGSLDTLGMFCWLPDWNDSGTRLAVNGTVYQPDGSPAAGVIVYIYHTDQTGHYPTRGNEKGWDRRHGYIRGWMRTNEKGEYKFFTLRPQPYPGREDPAHIHIIIKEPGKSPYWIDEYLFEDDPLLTEPRRAKLENRGGSGVLHFRDYYKGRSTMKSERNIYLGRNIPGYPK